MSWKSSPAAYGRVAIALHWSIAILLVVAVASGFATDAFGASGHGPLRVHAICGISAGVLTIVRIIWWLVADTKPEEVANTPAWQSLAAKAVHLLLTLIPLGMAASGIGMFALSGAADALLSGGQLPLPDFDGLAPRRPHGLGARALIALVVLHVAAALYHHYALNDGLLRRMWAKRG